MRIAAFQQVGGLNLTLKGSEDEELSLRLRQQGWKILRLDTEMVLHDAQMTKFSQWWQRKVRSGYSYAQRTWLHSASLESYYLGQN